MSFIMPMYWLPSHHRKDNNLVFVISLLPFQGHQAASVCLLCLISTSVSCMQGECYLSPTQDTLFSSNLEQTQQRQDRDLQ